MRSSLILAVSFVFAGTTLAHAEEFVLPDASTDPVHQCNNPHVGDAGSYQIDWDYLGFDQDTGNPHGTLHISGASGAESNVNVTMSNQTFISTYTDPPTGNYEQASFIFSMSGEGATFNYEDILGITLESDGLIDMRGTQIDEGQMFTLTIVTTSQTYTFGLESIQGSQLNFNAQTHELTGANLRFCAGLIPDNPPVIPEPTTLFGLGLVAVSAFRAARRKLVA
jgi:hypothetical protein